MKNSKYTGIVQSVHRGNIKVALASLQLDKANYPLFLSYNKKRTFTVVISAHGKNFHPGDNVSVIFERNPLRLLFFTFFLPAVFIFSVFNILLIYTGTSSLSAIMTLITLGPFFAFIWFLKDIILTQVKLTDDKD